MFEIGDTVRVVGNGEVRRIVGIGPGEFFRPLESSKIPRVIALEKNNRAGK